MNNNQGIIGNIGNSLATARDSIANVATNAVQGVQAGVQNVQAGVQNVVGNVGANLNAGIQNAKQGIANYMPQAPQMGSPTSGSFWSSNSIIFKFVFIILVVIVFLFLFKIGVALIGYFMQPKDQILAINGLSGGQTPLTIPRDPKKTGSVTLLHSNDRQSGLEFTWSVWLNLQPNTNKTTTFSHIFSVGNSIFDSVSGIATVSNAPGLYLRNLDKEGNQMTTANLMITMNTLNDGTADASSVEISDLPIGTWFNFIIRQSGVNQDIYVNGTISGRLTFINTPIQNYEDINVAQNGGFNGSLSNLQYTDYSLNIFEISALVSKGPNLTPAVIPSSSTNVSLPNYQYLSSQWYAAKM
jgi:hypothetical protein